MSDGADLIASVPKSNKTDPSLQKEIKDNVIVYVSRWNKPNAKLILTESIFSRSPQISAPTFDLRTLLIFEGLVFVSALAGAIKIF